MHYLPILPSTDFQSFSTGMHNNAPLVVTNVAQRSDLGQCVISTSEPHIVAKIHTFKTSVKNERIASERDKERCDYLKQRVNAMRTAKDAADEGLTVAEYIKHHGGNYDEEYDEYRMVAKVPGCNVYIELYGCMDNVENATAPNVLSLIAHDLHCDPSLSSILISMSVWMRTWMDEDRRKDTATKRIDWQPIDQWKEDYDRREFFRRNPELGIGLSRIDPSRRPERYSRHQMTDTEKYYLHEIMANAEVKGITITNAQAQQQAIARAKEDELLNRE